MSGGPPLALTAVDKFLAGTAVLREVSFECQAGAITALLGPNGAGKTTSVSVATGLRAVDAGQARVFGRTVRDQSARRLFSLVPQDVGLPAAVTVRRCLQFVGGQRSHSRFAPPDAETWERLAIGPLLDRRAGGLSGGEQRRVAVALGLLRVPGLLIMDEATTNLDEATRATTWQLVREYTDRGGAALVTSHILADIESHADQVVALNGGRVVLQSPLEQVRTQLGGSSVSVRVPLSRRAELLAQLAGLRLGAVPVPAVPVPAVPVPAVPVPAASVPAASAASAAVLEWRTRQPLPLVAAIAALAPDAGELLVRPIPLGELLAQLATAAQR